MTELTEEQKANVRKWVVALRSGEYEQGRGQLLDEHNRMCCLGVACAVYMDETGRGKWTDPNDDGFMYFMTEHGGRNAISLPFEVREWLGMMDDDPALSGGRRATMQNDGGTSFEEIADAIEETYLV